MPKLIKGNAVVEDSWRRLADTDATPDSGSYLIPLEKWLGLTDVDHKNASLAPWIGPDDDIEESLSLLMDASLIAIDFPTFMDGRGFSTAEILRHGGYAGELRAIGNLIQDQLFFLKRCGFDTIELREGTDLEKAVASLEDFSICYQTSADTKAPLFRRR
jgi:Uncharacterized protein conserved in bacteria